MDEAVEHPFILPHPPPAPAGVSAVPGRVARRFQTYGVLVVTATRPERSRIGRDITVQSLLMWRTPSSSAAAARAAVSAR